MSRRVWNALAPRAGDALRAARDFLRGFTGLPAAHERDASVADAASARRSLTERAEKRPRCC